MLHYVRAEVSTAYLHRAGDDQYVDKFLAKVLNGRDRPQLTAVKSKVESPSRTERWLLIAYPSLNVMFPWERVRHTPVALSVDSAGERLKERPISSSGQAPG